ncbi:prohead protease [Porphyromonas phage phage007a_Bg4]
MLQRLQSELDGAFFWFNFAAKASEKMANKTFVLHDETVNTYGFRMLTDGANLEEFRKNPVMLLDHNDWSLPIGRWENIRKEGGKILANAVFDMRDPKAAEVARKVEENFIRMASIGAWPPEEKTDDSLYKLPGQTGPTVTKWTVREASIVTIGANHNALAFYDRETGKLLDLTDQSAVVKLMDNVKPTNKRSMSELTQILRLSDGASEQDVTAAVKALASDNERLRGENKTLSDAVTKHNDERKKKEKEEAIALVDAAVRDGRINADGKDTYLQFFDKDFESAKKALAAIPVRSRVTAHIQGGAGASATELSDLSGKSWDELDKANKLTLLHDSYPDLYAQKFEERFGCKPTNV